MSDRRLCHVYHYSDRDRCRADYRLLEHQNCPAGLPMDGRALRPLYQNADAGFKPGSAFYGSYWPQDQYDGTGAGYPFSGDYLAR
ncbi:hypothetical protein D3C71_2041090 [compost metagenome]